MLGLRVRIKSWGCVRVEVGWGEGESARMRARVIVRKIAKKRN